MKTIANFLKPEEAHLFKLRLAASGIQSFLQDETVTQLNPWRAAAGGGVRVQVEEEDTATASRLLSDCYSPLLYANTAEASYALNCLSCQAPFLPETSRCQRCGWSYEDANQDRDRSR